MAATREQLRVIEAQREYFASDERIKERAALWRDATPEECLAATIESCAEAEYFLGLQSPEQLERALAPRADACRYDRDPRGTSEASMMNAASGARRIAECFDEDGIPYAIGGAIALGRDLSRR
jgi:hypothetical protein